MGAFDRGQARLGLGVHGACPAGLLVDVERHQLVGRGELAVALAEHAVEVVDAFLVVAQKLGGALNAEVQFSIVEEETNDEPVIKNNSLFFRFLVI